MSKKQKSKKKEVIEKSPEKPLHLKQWPNRLRDVVIQSFDREVNI